MQVVTKKDSFPRHLDIEFTSICQLECKTCPNSVIDREGGAFMRPSLLDKILREVKGKVKTCSPHGIGEPLLHPHAVSMLGKILSADIYVALSTNMMLLTEDMVEKLFNIELNELILPLWTLEKGVYEKLRKGVDFDEVLKNVDACIEMRRKNRDAKTFLHIHVLDTNETRGAIEQIKAKYEKALEGIGGISIKGYSVFGGLVPQLVSRSAVFVWNKCYMPNYSMTVYCDGTVVVCCNDAAGATFVGDARRQSLQEIWDRSLYDIYRKAIIDDDGGPDICRACRTHREAVK